VQLYYHHFASPTVRKVRAVAFQLDLMLEEIQVDYDARAHLESRYLALNPNAKFPTLVDGDFVLWESNAICQYLAAQRPESGLLPRDERQRADTLRWQLWELAHLSPAAARLVGARSSNRPTDAVALQTLEADFRRWAAVLDGALRGRRFLVDDALTVADISVASMLLYEPAKLPLDEHLHVQPWLQMVAALPGWQRSTPPAV
jgi:glutathione S-transferase